MKIYDFYHTQNNYDVLIEEMKYKKHKYHDKDYHLYKK